MQFEYDPERLIDEVKKRPGIWDWEDPDYRAKVVRHQLWQEIVSEMLNTDVKMNKSELRELEIELQKKWKSIRDCFNKYIHNPQRTRRPYIYTKQLQFLLKNQSVEDECSDGDGPKRKKWRQRRKMSIKKDDASSEEETRVSESNDDAECTVYVDGEEEYEVPKKTAKQNEPPTEEFLFANVDAQQSKYDSDDPDRMFLLSLLPHLKSIPEDMRINVKMDLMQVLQNANISQKIF
ncbi:hypothetical protein ACJJTC_012188 [Scirpophaga incertulas]